MTDRESIVAFMAKQPDRTTVRDLEQMIERGDDLTPKATIADLLALHDLDLGALAHKVGVTGEGFTSAQADALCAHLGDHPMSEDFVRAVANQMPGAWLDDLRTLSALGAKVRAALSVPTLKVVTPRVLQSADEAPVRPSSWTLFREGFRGVGGVAHSRSVVARAEGLTEAECRHLSGMSAQEAIAWCERRAQGQEAMRRG